MKVAVSLRGKLPSVDVRTFMRAILYVDVALEAAELCNGFGTAVAAVHEKLRAEVSEDQILAQLQLTNRMYDQLEIYARPPSKGDSRVLMWNSQAAAPFYKIDLGAGPAERGVPWNVGTVPVTVVPNARDGLDVLVSHDPKGVISWCVDEAHRAALFPALEDAVATLDISGLI